METDRIESVRLGGTTQWIRVQSAGRGNPPLLLIQQGPGLPMISAARGFERALRLAEEFTVIYWDQRECGLSRRRQATAGEVSLRLMASDTVELLSLARERFGVPAAVAGFSLGGTIGTLAAASRPDLVATLVTAGMDVSGPEAEAGAYDFALAAARDAGHARALRQLTAIGPPPHLTPKAFGTRLRWVADFGGIWRGRTYRHIVRGLVQDLIRSRDYAPADIARTIRGFTAAQKALLPELAALDLPSMVSRLDVPVLMIQGRHDQAAPAAALERFAAQLDAPAKELAWFEHSAHFPHFEEPERFRELLMLSATRQAAHRSRHSDKR